MAVEDDALLAFVRAWGGIAVYPKSADPNQLRLVQSAQRLVDQGRLAARRDGESLLVMAADTEIPAEVLT